MSIKPTSKASTTLLVDGNSIAWRCYYAIRGLRARGVPTGMAYGFLRTLRNALDNVSARECWVVWDGGVPAFRRALLPTYKAARKSRLNEEERTEFRQQQDWLSAVLLSFGVGWMRFQGWEADDVLAWSARRKRAEEKHVVVLSGDRDMWQLVEEHVSVLAPGKMEPITLSNFSPITGFPSPQYWARYRVLSGDASDGIPGVGKIGDKRARELVLERGWPMAISVPREWWMVRGAAVDRNRALMDLHHAANLIDLEPPPTTRECFLPVRELTAARRALGKAGMDTLLATWATWSEPFRRLGR